MIPSFSFIRLASDKKKNGGFQNEKYNVSYIKRKKFFLRKYTINRKLTGILLKITKKQEKPSINLVYNNKILYKQKHFLDNKINIS